MIMKNIKQLIEAIFILQLKKCFEEKNSTKLRDDYSENKKSDEW